MRGNAFSAFHVAPVFVSTLSTWGRFADVDSAVDKDQDVVDENRHSDDNASANMNVCAADVDLFAEAEAAQAASDGSGSDTSSQS